MTDKEKAFAVGALQFCKESALTLEESVVITDVAASLESAPDMEKKAFLGRLLKMFAPKIIQHGGRKALPTVMPGLLGRMAGAVPTWLKYLLPAAGVTYGSYKGLKYLMPEGGEASPIGRKKQVQDVMETIPGYRK